MLSESQSEFETEAEIGAIRNDGPGLPCDVSAQEIGQRGSGEDDSREAAGRRAAEGTNGENRPADLSAPASAAASGPLRR